MTDLVFWVDNMTGNGNKISKWKNILVKYTFGQHKRRQVTPLLE